MNRWTLWKILGERTLLREECGLLECRDIEKGTDMLEYRKFEVHAFFNKF